MKRLFISIIAIILASCAGSRSDNTASGSDTSSAEVYGSIQMSAESGKK